MPRVAASNGIRPEFRALTLFKLNEPVTPDAINKLVATGNYAAKYISLLKKVGFEFSVQKVGKSVVSYTLIKEPANADKFRTVGPVVAKVVEKVVAKAPQVSRSNLTIKVKTKTKPARKAKTDAFGNDALTGEVATYATDYDYEEKVSLRDLGLDAFA